MVAFYIIPNIAIMLIMSTIYNYNHSSLVFIIGILLIPMFTRKITESKSSFLEISRSLIIYIPWIFAFTVFIYTSVGFLGIYSYESINLGFIIHRTYEYHVVLEHFRAIFWPGLAILLFLIGLILLHEGLKDKKMI